MGGLVGRAVALDVIARRKGRRDGCGREVVRVGDCATHVACAVGAGVADAAGQHGHRNLSRAATAVEKERGDEWSGAALTEQVVARLVAGELPEHARTTLA